MFNTRLKFFAFGLALAMFLSVFFVFTSATAETAIPISTKEEFDNIRNNLNGSYYLTCDIVFSDSDFAVGGEYYNSGKCFLPIGDGNNPFKGTFDGRGFKVSGIKISVSGKVYSMSVTPIETGVSSIADDGWTGDYIISSSTSKPTVSPAVGVFGSNCGVIKNVNISQCRISANSSNSAKLFVGGVAGHNNGSILNCSVDNTLNCNSRSYIGGITGYQSGGTIKNCFVRGQIESDGVYGGIAGAVADGSVLNSYSAAKFTSTSAAAIKTASVNILDDINNCYYISDVQSDGIGENISVVNAKNPTSFKEFDFANVWYMSGTLRAPALKEVEISEGADVTTGDLNANGKVDLLDLVSLAQYVANWDVSVCTEVSNVNFNFTENGEDVVDLNDVAYLARYLAGWKDAVIY